MDMLEIIAAKRDGGKLDRERIHYFVKGFTEGSIPDYQASALLMAVYLKGLDDEETFMLTDEMLASGASLDLSAINGIKVDKHSTGGVGDKTTLIVGPVAAVCGVPVAKMSGRGLGFSGGTADKLEAIPGFRTQLETDEFMDQVNRIGIAVATQTANIAPADKKIYALRDVTATVGNKSLIASSIMSKKLASGADAIVLDVKCGNGALVKTPEESEELAKIMISIGKQAGRRMTAVISDMDQPLGNAVGNTLEVIEAIETLKGNGPEDLKTVCTALASQMIVSGGKAADIGTAEKMVSKALSDGSALNKLREMIAAQGGNADVTEDYSLMAGASLSADICAEEDGYVAAINTEAVGEASRHAGAGRLSKDDVLDMGAGVMVYKKIADRVSKGDVLMTVFANDSAKLESALSYGIKAYTINSAEPVRPEIIRAVLI